MKYNELPLPDKIKRTIKDAKRVGKEPAGYALQVAADELLEVLWNAQHRGEVLGLTVTLKDFEVDVETFANNLREVGHQIA